MEQIKIQILGILLALMTALGCIAYEKMVKTHSFIFVGICGMLSAVPFVLAAKIFQPNFQSQPVNKWWIAVYIMTGCTGPLWYWITRTKSILVSSVFEIKYIVILAIFSILIGEKGVTPYTIVGALLAMASIYFISK